MEKVHTSELMSRLFLLTAALLAGLAVAAGAFASHALRSQLSERSLQIFETAARYQMYHALALALVALWLEGTKTGSEKILRLTGYAFIVGTVLFSGSLYGLSVSGISWLGAITPLGGAAYLCGWFCFALFAWSRQ